MFSFHITRLQAKLTLLYLLMSILPIILISTLSYQVYYQSMTKEMYALVDQNAQLHEQMIAERFQGQKRILYEMVTSRDLIALADQLNQQPLRQEDSLVVISKSALAAKFQTYAWTSSYINSMVFISNTDEYVFYSKHFSLEPSVIWSDPQTRTQLYQSACDADQVVYFPTRSLSMSGSTPFYSVIVGYPVRDLATRETKGVLLMALDEVILRGYSDQSATGVTTVVTDGDGTVLSYSDGGFITQPVSSLYADLFNHTSLIREQFTPIGGTAGWQILNIIDEPAYLQEVHAFSKIVIVFTVCISLLFFFIVYLISMRYTRSISRITQGITTYAAGEDRNVAVEIDDKDDLYVIAHQFNQMTLRVNSLVEDLERKNEAIRQAVTRQKKAEIKALESQINPHFLYNTLDSINWMAIENDQIEISNLLGKLGSMLRYSVSNIDVVVTLSAEVEWLKKYVFLQRERFGGSFDLTCSVTGEALDFPVYKLLLQPIVENSILHGFEDVKAGGLIALAAHIGDDGMLYVSIRDNGCGMSAQTLEQVRGLIDSVDPLDGESIGISNIVNRLRLYYHGAAGIAVESSPGKGTEFRLTLPNTEWNEAPGPREV